MKKRILCTFVLLVILGIVACTHVTIRKTEEDAGSTVAMNRGDDLLIVLKANPTTGHQWEITAADSTILRHTETAYKPDPVPANIAGGGGKSFIRFEAKAIGRTDVKLIYHRPFETDVPPVRTFELSIVVAR